MNDVRQLRRQSGVTQATLAQMAGTSQPTIAAYEGGTKSPNLRTLRRLAEAVGLEVSVNFVKPMTREDRRSLALHRAIALRLAGDPESVLRKARRNLQRMTEQNPGAQPLLSRWRRLLAGPVEEILEVLRNGCSEARELRHVTPFAGVLSPRERVAVYQEFSQSEARRP